MRVDVELTREQRCWEPWQVVTSAMTAGEALFAPGFAFARLVRL